jgi:hypothetical protein
MDRKTQWASLVAGGFLFIYGLKRLYQESDWVILIISALIIAFTVSSILKSKQKE